ncbi:MAG: isoleucine--tRNA ligase [Bacteroidetes bacterium]|nr:isoleucine--tRNA ligase [Bacteroidota bacterium]
MYPTLKQLNWPAIETEILKFWEEQEIFEASIQQRPADKSFTFYEGPPSANGMPGIHHVMARAIKDIFCRYKTLAGYRVERKAGWDTHGLPIELQVEKRLGIRKDDIGFKISVEEYNRECRQDVMMFKDKWDELTRRIGFWVDLENPYITYENNYIETLWYLLKQLYQKNLLYKGYTIQPYSPAAGTGLSSHELNQPGTYKPLRDTTVVAQFQDKQNPNHYFLAWTTTPWTLPSNTALAVGANIDYVRIATVNPYTGQTQEVTLAKDLMGKYFQPEGENAPTDTWKPGDKVLPWSILSTCKGNDLQGMRYEQLLPYARPETGDAFVVVTADFVSTEDGTGIVHIAPSFGSDDFRTAQIHGLGSLTLVDRKGRFTAEVTDFAGEFVKEQFLSDEEREEERIKQGRDKYLNVDERISIKLKQENKAFKVEKFEHSYPHCWRTDKPILYYPLESWFVKTTAAKDRLVELNKTINWKPKSTGEGRFGNWLENLVDWNLSRSRYWGTPLPIWRTEDGSEEICIGSLDELVVEIHKANAQLGLEQEIDPDKLDLHRPIVDYIKLVSQDGQVMHREPDLIDVWFDSGAMPYAQHHWPFENKEAFEASFPADFIAEGVDQTRGWFFTLHAISVLLYDRVAFKNVIANGLVLDKNGNKMSKRLGNAVDPFATVDQYGADALRWYMVTNAPPWDNLKFDPEGVEEAQRKFFGTLYNTYSFFAIYANIDGFRFDREPSVPMHERTELDRWILSRLNSLILEAREAYEDYDPTRAGRAIEDFVTEHLSNWYVRLSRRRFWKGELNRDKVAAYQTLFQCLDTVSRLMSPISPFFSDWLFRSLHTAEIAEKGMVSSVHLSDLPEAQTTLIDRELEDTMEIAEKASSLILSLRKKERLKVRQPLQKAMIPVLNEEFGRRLKHVESLILSEVNVKELQYLDAGNALIVKKVKPNFKTLGPQLGADMKQLSNAVAEFTQAQITQLESTGSLAVDLGTRQFELQLADVEILTQDMPGWLVASEGGITVALDITLSPELRAEGTAREFVNRVQNLRKDSGLDVTDRIQIVCNGSIEFEQSVTLFMPYICSEVLADGIVFATGPQAHETEIDEKPVHITITKS